MPERQEKRTGSELKEFFSGRTPVRHRRLTCRSDKEELFGSEAVEDKGKLDLRHGSSSVSFPGSP